MKKGLMLSLAASAVLFAGGDIAPVEPVAEAPAAACDDFYGFAGAGVIFESHASTENNATATYSLDYGHISSDNYGVGLTDDATASNYTYGVVALLGVHKEIVSGLTVSAEVQGVAFKHHHEVASAAAGIDDSCDSRISDAAALNELALAYTWCNTAFKVGRFTIDGAVSPLVATPKDYFGLKDKSFEGGMIVNTDLPDTTVWGAYVRTIVSHQNADSMNFSRVGANANNTSTRKAVDVVAAGLINTSFADTKITLAAYYDVTGDDQADARGLPWTYMVAGSIDKKWCDTDISLGAGYTVWDDNTSGADNSGSDYIIGGTIKQNFNSSFITVGATYGNMKYTKYTDFTNHKVNDNNNSWAVGVAVGTDWCGYKFSAFGNYREDETYQAGAKVSKVFSGIDFSVDYRFNHNGVNKIDSHRIRAKAIYNF